MREREHKKYEIIMQNEINVHLSLSIYRSICMSIHIHMEKMPFYKKCIEMYREDKSTTYIIIINK